MPVLLLWLVALLPAPSAIEGDPLPGTEQGLRDRARDLLGAGEDGRTRLAGEAVHGPAAARRAALEALATLPAAAFPPGTVEAALAGLGAADPPLRRAALDVLLAAGDPVLPVLERLEKGPVPGLPAVLPERARDARFDCRRAAVEREFLALWTSDDGTFAGMFAPLKAHGPFGAKVLAAISVDRRMAAGEVLDFGPYAWLAKEAAERDRIDCRYRALEALADAGDREAQKMLRPFLRHSVGPDGETVDEPAAELYDESDRNPVPAPLDDALREAIAALGDKVPLLNMIERSRNSPHFGSDEFIEIRRQASAYATLAAASAHPKVRLGYLAEAERLQLDCLDRKFGSRLPVDGVEYYNLACLYGRRNGPGDRERSLKYLEWAVNSYSVSARWLMRDGDLASLHAEPRFQALVERLSSREKAIDAGKPVPR